MDESRVVMWAKDNAMLLRQLELDFKASGIGNICNFFDQPPDWRCPCCHRTKPDFARLDKNRDLLCAMHRHHDHFGDFARDKLPRSGYTEGIVESFCRFPETLICADCNVAEPAAKAIVEAPEQFSFAPYEIATFVTVRKQSGHIVRPDCAKRAYEAARPGMRLVNERLNAVVKSARADDDTFEHIGGAAWRALKEINERRKAAK